MDLDRTGAVKICGVTRREDARRCVELGAELIGLNFHRPSPRFVSREQAVSLRREIGDRALTVGVFVEQTPAEAVAVGERLGLDLLQFHGDVEIGELEGIAERSIVVVRPHEEDRARSLAGAGLWGVLFDAPIEVDSGGATLFGGTGSAWDYERVSRLANDGARLMLAGGVRPENAERALAVEGVWGIDVCSGVEASPGVKDPERLQALFAVRDGVGRRARGEAVVAGR